MVSVREYRKTELEAIWNMEISDEQKAYVKIDLEALIAMAEGNLQAMFLTICNGEEPVGFACCLLDDEGDMNLVRLMIDKWHQGKGYARAAMPLLLNTMRPFALKGEVWLGVHPQNKRAIRLYEGAGFVREAIPLDDEEEIFYRYVYTE